MGRKNIQWEKPEKKRSLEKELPYDKEIITKSAKISKDSRDLFFVRFPREISDAIKFSEEDLLEYTVETPIPLKDKKDIKVSFKLIRRD
ncbi:MAG: hypothetical protein ABIJ92_04460 [Candidatus Aenigmatarchaeota archaeon]